jgi:prepilin-type N-terminal cleavage/methylation domain-containing protein
MKQKIDNSSGFTLIEVLIAAVIITFGMLAMGTFLGSLVSKNSINERKTIATLLAQDKIEDLRRQALKTDLTSADNSVSPHETITTDAGPFNRSWTIAEDFAGLSDQITIVIDWEGPGNSDFTLTTLIND